MLLDMGSSRTIAIIALWWHGALFPIDNNCWKNIPHIMVTRRRVHGFDELMMGSVTPQNKEPPAQRQVC